MLTKEAGVVITDVFKNRWRTLMSVDDVIADVIGTCTKLGIADNTYFFYSSDHGFQLGEFNIAMDKRHVYDWDTRIHLLSRGPGIAKGSTFSLPATQVDLAPTFLGIAGLAKPASMDGKSLLPLLTAGASLADLPASARDHITALGQDYAKGWRDAVFIEYYFVDDNDKCMANCKALKPGNEYPSSDSLCGDLTSGKNAECWGGKGCNKDCYRTEDEANNFIGLRSMGNSIFGDTLYAEFVTGSQYKADIDFSNVSFTEYYNASADPWMTNNLAPATGASALADLKKTLHTWFNCAGDSCL
jgi:N-acetylglucosamine-6-sulfatase